MKNNKKNSLTSEERNMIYNYKKENPKIKQKDIALWFTYTHQKNVTQSTISTILRNNGIKSRNRDNNIKIENISNISKNKIDKRYIKTNNTTKDVAIDYVKKLIIFFMEQKRDYKNEIINLLNINETLKD
jgi:ribosomal protein L20A (L18A)